MTAQPGRSRSRGHARRRERDGCLCAYAVTQTPYGGPPFGLGLVPSAVEAAASARSTAGFPITRISGNGPAGVMGRRVMSGCSVCRGSAGLLIIQVTQASGAVTVLDEQSQMGPIAAWRASTFWYAADVERCVGLVSGGLLCDQPGSAREDHGIR